PVPGCPAAWAFLVSSPSIAAHSFQANKPFSYSASAMANAWASQGARKTGPLVSRGMPGTASAARRAASGSIDDDSGMFQIRLERLDGNLQPWIRVCAPELPGIETNRIKPLWIFALADSHGVGKHVSAMQPFDYADVSARVTR